MITGEEFIDELLENYPQINNFFLKYNISLLVCGEPAWGSLKNFLKTKNIQNIDKIINELNEYLKSNSHKENTIKKANDNLKIDFK